LSASRAVRSKSKERAKWKSGRCCDDDAVAQALQHWNSGWMHSVCDAFLLPTLLTRSLGANSQPSAFIGAFKVNPSVAC
jgi:hypothetical protein